MPKIAEMKLSSCGLKVADIRKKELRLRSNISLKSCEIAIAEVFPSSCGIAIADSKKSCACPPLINSQLKHGLLNFRASFEKSEPSSYQICINEFLE
jgi:hypothetical protein